MELEKQGMKTEVKVVIGVVVGIVLLALLFGFFRIIDQGERGVVLRFGEVNRIMEPGLNLKIPLVESVKKIETRTVKIETEATAASNDLQDVTTKVAVQYSLNASELGSLYAEYKDGIRSRLIDPAIQDAVKAATAKFNAAALIQERPLVKEEIQRILRERFEGEYITLQNVDIINFAFSQSFAQAIEEKVTAEQNAEREENRLRQVEFEAQQRIEEAKAEAEAIRIQAQAITQQGGKDYVMLKWVEAWQAGGSQVPKFISGGDGENFLLDINSL